MKLHRPAYNSKEWLIMPFICFAFTFIINSIYFGKLYYSSGLFFIGATIITYAELIIDFLICGYIALLLTKRFPDIKQTAKKLGYMIVSFVLLSSFLKYLLFKLYEILPFFKTELNENRLAWVCLSIAIANIFLIFLMEGISRYETWQQSVKETALLNTNYRQTQLNALKSHITPHFLFNNLNTLSSLIEENEDMAEDFLNEMTKVYRYMLKNDSDQLVTLDTELQFLQSYLHLMEKRFGEGLRVNINIPDVYKQKYIVPMLLQVIIENAFSQNAISRLKPLEINIFSEDVDMLLVQNLRRPKIISTDLEIETGLDTMVKKYKLLGKQLGVTDIAGDIRKISIQLINENVRA
ncbi:MAG: histidine kinase [Agriterribacter sp.]